MRILHVVPSFYPAVHYGGPIYSVLHLCLQLRRLECEVQVLTTDANGPRTLTPEQQRDPLLDPLQVQFCHRLGGGTVAPELARVMPDKCAWADVIHLTAVYNFSTIPTLMAARRCGKPLVWSPRGTLQRWEGSRRVLAKSIWEFSCRRLLPQKVALHVTSKEEAQESSPRLGNLPVWVIPNGIDVPAPAPAAPSDGLLKLLFLGRLDGKKGLENLISSTSLLIQSGFTRWTLKIVGEGDPSYEAQLRRLATRAGVDDRVEFCGHLDGEMKHKCFENSDIVVVPSHTENFAIVVAEALAHARAVIASMGTPWSGIERYGCGMWVNNDSASLASAIRRMSQCDLVAMGERGRKWMISEFSWQDRAQEMLTLYQHLINSD